MGAAHKSTLTTLACSLDLVSRIRNLVTKAAYWKRHKVSEAFKRVGLFEKKMSSVVERWIAVDINPLIEGLGRMFQKLSCL
ncbi:hypothetical protein TNCT_313431 [Trichonephila clavata]|uniref:Uncharacterized protein n=1 Tax=Trichonephila clavata TaxID=2740835 RepID=A0A8X6LPF0_TRICU|nr:hypothetical protein TNCT_313431 [Trichonephila clavata]